MYESRHYSCIIRYYLKIWLMTRIGRLIKHGQYIIKSYILLLTDFAIEEI